jgi:hypothetical protein
MVEDAAELVEAVYRRHVFIAVAQMVLTDLRDGIAEGFQ